MQTRVCNYGHSLESKQVTGGTFGLVNRNCKQCYKQLKKDDWRFTCKTCNFHLCATCFASPTCTKGHRLERFEHTSGFLGLNILGNYICTECRKDIVPGSWRNTCKHCNYHLCDSCLRSLQVRQAQAFKAAPGGAVCPPAGVASVPGVPTTSFHLPQTRRACRWGTKCYQKNAAHLEKFVHPGDRNYRIGLVIFDTNVQPEFETLWQIFQYHDPDESGFLSRTEFTQAWDAIRLVLSDEAADQGHLRSAEESWKQAGGQIHGYVNFRQFVTWTQAFLEFPVGLEMGNQSDRKCRFLIMSAGGDRCSCPNFEPSDASGLICVCGHKASMHRSDGAQGSFATFAENARASRTREWADGVDGLVEIEDPAKLRQLQQILDATHKKSDNWTRDRGCRLHGVNGAGCTPNCAKTHAVAVPKGYSLFKAYRNQNEDIWQKYCLLKTAISEECKSTAISMVQKSVATSGCSICHDVLDDGNNEWYLFHGTTKAKAQAICRTNFRTELAGMGATWKDSGKKKGTPLYGYGIYLAENITKADEYSEAFTKDEELLPEDTEGEFFTILVCRVWGGRTNVVTTNEIVHEKLRENVFAGPYHSVYGDRVSVLNKPYREIVVYEKDQCYPEFLLVYRRNF